MVGGVFEYILVLSNKNTDGDEINSSIIGQDRIMCKDAQAATMAAGRAIPEEYKDRLADIEIRLRPF